MTHVIEGIPHHLVRNSIFIFFVGPRYILLDLGALSFGLRVTLLPMGC